MLPFLKSGGAAAPPPFSSPTPLDCLQVANLQNITRTYNLKSLLRLRDI